MITRKSRNRISPLRRRFAGIIVDVGYDHFLSRHWGDFSKVDLAVFVERVYAVLMKNRDLLPDRLSRILPHMISENWLRSYVHLKGVGDALDRIAGRLSRGEKFLRAVTEIENNYGELEKDFLAFFPDLAAFCMEWKNPWQCSVSKRPAGWHGEAVSGAWTGRTGGRSATAGHEHIP